MAKYIMFPLFALVASIVLSSSLALAAPSSGVTMTFNFREGDIVKMIEDYSKASGQRIIVDPQVRGKATIFNPSPISLDEAFNQLSTALMVNGLAFSKQGDTWLVLQARAVQRNLIDVVTELPPLKPEKMVTWMIKLKYVSAAEVNNQLRILTSANGELVPFTHTNQIIVSDYVSNLHRIAAILKQLDQPATPSSKRASGPTKSN